MFQFRRFPTYTYLIQCTLHRYCLCGLPHSEIPGSMDICSSPRLIAAYRVLHRLSVPRHSPCALSSLTNRKLTIFSLVLVCELCRQSQILFEIVIVTHHLFRCCSTIKSKTLSVSFQTQKPLCGLTSLALYIVQFSRCKTLPASFEARSQSLIS